MPRGGIAERTEVINLRVKPGAKERLNQIAKKRGITFSDAARMALAEGVAIMEKR